MTEPVHVLFVASPADERAVATVREQPNIVVETASSADEAHERLHAIDCVVCTPNVPDTDAVSFLRDVQRSSPSCPCLFVSDAGDSMTEEVLDGNVASWVPSTGGERALANRIAHIAENVRHERRLATVQESFEALTTAETEEVVAETAVSVLSADLGYDVAIVARYDAESGTLEPITWNGVPEPDGRLFDSDDGIGWTTFLQNQTQRERRDEGAMANQWLAVPLGRYGVLIAGQGTRDDETTLVEMLASNVEAAFIRLDREQELATRDATLSNTEGVLERTQRRESVVRDVLSALVWGDTRTDIEEDICKRLTDADPYRFAWIGEYDATTNELEPRTWVGNEKSFLDDLSAIANDETAETTARKAVRTRSSVVDDDLLGEPPYESWRQEALKRGYRSAVSVPFIYRGSIYGVLTVYVDDHDTFDEAEQNLLEDIGGAIAYGINAVESKKALVSDSAVELEFRITDPQFTVIKFVQMVDCRFEFESVIRETDDTLRLFFTTVGTTPRAVLSFSDQSLVVNDIRHITSDDSKDLFECTITGSNVISLLLDHGAIPKAAIAEGSEARLTVELPQTADVRRFVETFQNQYTNTELVARRKRNRPVQTEQDFRTQLRHRLTDRQSEALETAYWSGFFEWPRESNGQEIAESLGVSQPTFNRHLRAAERNLLTELFEDE